MKHGLAERIESTPADFQVRWTDPDSDINECSNPCFIRVNPWLYLMRVGMRRLVAGVCIAKVSFVAAN
jgi:hypothetical protein